ncbi:MAG: hypothetical protein QM773_10890 [Hyphomonadaceae bacterium]
MKKILAVSALAMLASGCANFLNSVGDKQALGPPDLFSMILIQGDPIIPEPQNGHGGIKINIENFKSELDNKSGQQEPKVQIVDQAIEKCDKNSVPMEDPGFTAQRHVCQTLKIFASTVNYALKNASNADRAKAMFKAGANASDALCFMWFAQLDGARRASAQARAVTGGLGALTNSVQVLTGVEPNPIGITSAAFAQLGLGFESTERNYLLPNNLALINNALKLYRMRTFDDFLKGTNGQPSEITDYFMAERYLRIYHETCSSNSIEYFIAESVQRAGTQTPTLGAQAAQLQFDMQMPALVVQVETALGLSQQDLSEEDVYAIWGYIFLKGKDAKTELKEENGADKYLTENTRMKSTFVTTILPSQSMTLGARIKLLKATELTALQKLIEESRVAPNVKKSSETMTSTYLKPK